MWKYRMKLAVWWLAPQFYWGLILWLMYPNYEAFNLIWSGVIVCVLLFYFYPRCPVRPRTRWWVQSRINMRHQWHDEAWSRCGAKAKHYLLERKKQYSQLNWRLVEEEDKA